MGKKKNVKVAEKKEAQLSVADLLVSLDRCNLSSAVIMQQEANMIGIVVEGGHCYQYSPVHRINGFPWRLWLHRTYDEFHHEYYKLEIICDKSTEAELWQCNASIALIAPYTTKYSKDLSFTSWDNYMAYVALFDDVQPGSRMLVKVTTKDNGESWRLRPILDPSKPLDGIIVIGEEKKKVEVNKESLASQSPFFRKLFNGNREEKNISEYSIDGVTFEEFSNIIALVYSGEHHSSRRFGVSDENVHRMLDLANRFGLKIVVDAIINFLLSSYSTFSAYSMHKKLLFSEQFKLPVLKSILLKDFNRGEVEDLLQSAEFEQLSYATLRVLFCKGSANAFTIDKSTGLPIPTSIDDRFRSTYWNEYSMPRTVSHDLSIPKKKESTTISMKVEKWAEGQSKQLSSIHRCNGFPWRLCISKGKNKRDLSVICEKSNEAELWKCAAVVSNKFCGWSTRQFSCWNQEHTINYSKKELANVGAQVKVTIETYDDGESWKSRPSVNPFEPRDGIIVIGEEKKKVYVNKQSLASQSSFFDRLFFGNFMEKNMEEIPIGDVTYEEFSSIIAMFYGDDVISLNSENVERFLQLADRFDLKIVEEKTISFFLRSSDVSVIQKFIVLDQYNYHDLMECLISEINSNSQLKQLSQPHEWNQLSKETLRILFKEFCV